MIEYIIGFLVIMATTYCFAKWTTWNLTLNVFLDEEATKKSVRQISEIMEINRK